MRSICRDRSLLESMTIVTLIAGADQSREALGAIVP
jgi:hypothetical protein